MHREGNKIILGKKNCSCSYNPEHAGKACGYVKCEKCRGTGRTKGGTGKGQCRADGCFSGRCVSWKPEHLRVCTGCNGQWENSQDENTCDSMPQEIWHSLEFRVHRANRALTWNEEHLAIGCVFSCVDYGRSWGDTDEKVIAEVREHKHIQATKVCRDDGTLCEYVGIFLTPGGYSVRAVYSKA